MSARPDLYDSPEVVALDHPADSGFDPGPHFRKWLQSLERTRNRTELCPGVYLEDGGRDFSEAMSLDDQLPDQVCSDGTLVVTDNYLKLRIPPGLPRNQRVAVRIDDVATATPVAAGRSGVFLF